MVGRTAGGVDEVLRELAGSYAVWVEAGNEFCAEEQARQSALEDEALRSGLAPNPYGARFSDKSRGLMTCLERVAFRVGREELPVMLDYLSKIDRSLANAGCGAGPGDSGSGPLSELARTVAEVRLSIVPPAEKYTPERPTLHPSIGESALRSGYLH